MATYLELKAQIANLQAQAEEARKQETAEAIGKIKVLMDQYGITIADLSANRRSSFRRDPVPPKYRDPLTGNTWTGRGKPPKWIVGVADRNIYLIK